MPAMQHLGMSRNVARHTMMEMSNQMTHMSCFPLINHALKFREGCEKGTNIIPSKAICDGQNGTSDWCDEPQL
jgi:hypothetical protein